MNRYFLTCVVLCLFQITWAQKAFVPKGKGTYATVQTTLGNFVIKLHSETHQATSSFVGLAQGKRPFLDIIKAEYVTRPFFDGLKFYDAMKSGYIASGCQENTGSISVGVGYSFVDECYRSTKTEIEGLILSEYAAAMVWANLLYPYFSSQKGNGPSKFLNDLCKNLLEKNTYSPLYKVDIELIRKELGENKKKIYKRELLFPVVYGSVCSFNKGAVNNNGSRFLIVTSKSGIPSLNGNATVFGKVIAGMDVVHQIENIIVDHKEKKVSVDKNPEITSISIKKKE